MTTQTRTALDTLAGQVVVNVDRLRAEISRLASEPDKELCWQMVQQIRLVADTMSYRLLVDERPDDTPPVKVLA